MVVIDSSLADWMKAQVLTIRMLASAGLLNYVPARTPVYLIDPKQVPIASGRKVHVIQKGASEGMEELKKILVG